MAKLECNPPCYNTTTFVPGEGPSQATLMFVGEAPGREEDEQGRPFVGGAGRVLNSLLSSAGINRRDVYITNVVKCRPPNNRTPTPQEVSRCKPFLTKEIARLQPKMIIALGEVASIVLTGKDISYRGCILPHIETKTPVLITFHPAYVMRNRKEYSTVVCDLEKVFNPPPTYSQQYLVNPPLEVVKDYLLRKWKDSWVAVDIETAGVKGQGLNPFTDDIIGIGFCGEPGVAISLSLNAFSPAWEVVKLFLESSTPKVMQNNTFDRLFLWMKGIYTQNLVWDTADAMHVLYSDASKSLDYLRSLYTNIPPYKKIYKDKSKGVAHLSTPDLGIYNCTDVDVTLQVALAQKKYFNPKLERVRERLLQLDTLAIHMRKIGVKVDPQRVALHYLKLQPEVAELEHEFYSQCGVNLASPKQISHFLFQVKKFPPPRSAYSSTSTGLSVDEEVLTSLLESTYIEEDKKLLEKILLHRELSKAFNTYILGLYALVEDDGRVHPEWKPTGTDTGRWACKSPNMQNVPKRLRDMFVADEGKVLFVADYSQLELLTAALLAEDHELVEQILKGKDVHEEVRQEMCKVAEATRMQAKAMVFGTIYGLTPRAGAIRFKVPEKTIERWQYIVMGRYPKLVQFRQRNIDFFNQNGYVESWFGRRKYCENVNQALNHPVQSTAADITLSATLKLFEAGLDPIIMVHDENVCEVKCNVEGAFDKFKQIIHNPVPELHSYFPAKFKRVQSWGDEGEEVKE
jgi:uracil-DNA glycosylase family 4